MALLLHLNILNNLFSVGRSSGRQQCRPEDRPTYVAAQHIKLIRSSCAGKADELFKNGVGIRPMSILNNSSNAASATSTD